MCLLAPGAIVAERWHRSTARRTLLAGAIAVTAAGSAVVGLPVIPVDRLHGTLVEDVNEDAGETVGWPAFARAVARAEATVPAKRRAAAVVFTGNYCEAGAIARYGPALGLPRAYSWHNAYARFGVPKDSAGPVLVLGYRDPDAAFRGCRLAGMIDNGYRLANEEQGGAIFVCAAPRKPWQALWAVLRHLDA